MKILTVEKSRSPRLGEVLSSYRHCYDRKDDTSEALDLLASFDYDLVVAVIIPTSDLKRLCDAAVRRGTPVLVLAGSPERILDSFQAGASQCLPWTAHPREIAAHMAALVRRRFGHMAATIGAGPLTLDLDRLDVMIGGIAMELPNAEYRMIEHLILRKGCVITRREIAETIYPSETDPCGEDMIAVLAWRLRKRLAPWPGAAEILETVRGMGYVVR